MRSTSVGYDRGAPADEVHHEAFAAWSAFTSMGPGCRAYALGANSPLAPFGRMNASRTRRSAPLPARLWGCRAYALSASAERLSAQ
eukprot:1707819-Prymnesium_polylepis.4